MTDRSDSPADAELVAVLRAQYADPDLETKQRVSARLASTIGMSLLSGPPSSPPAPVPGAARALLGVFRGHPLAFAASFLLGSAAGAGVYAATLRPAPPEIRLVYVDRPAPSAPSSNGEPPAPPSATEALSAAPLAVSAPSAGAGHGSTGLAEQQALLDVARAAFARGDYTTTLRTLNLHFRHYPASLLSEERAALEIKALSADGRSAEAKARAVRFKARFPQSLLLPSLIGSVGAIP